MKLESLEVDNSIFISDSLCSYYKCLWSKCKRLWTNMYIHTFWLSYGSEKKSKGKPQTQYNHSYHWLRKNFPWQLAP